MAEADHLTDSLSAVGKDDDRGNHAVAREAVAFVGAPFLEGGDDGLRTEQPDECAREIGAAHGEQAGMVGREGIEPSTP